MQRHEKGLLRTRGQGQACSQQSQSQPASERLDSPLPQASQHVEENQPLQAEFTPLLNQDPWAESALADPETIRDSRSLLREVEWLEQRSATSSQNTRRRVLPQTMEELLQEQSAQSTQEEAKTEEPVDT